MVVPVSRLRRIAAYALLQLAVFGILWPVSWLFVSIPLVTAAVCVGPIRFNFRSLGDFLITTLLLAFILGSMFLTTDFLMQRHQLRYARAVLIAYPFAIC